jgi:hypothetical protein
MSITMNVDVEVNEIIEVFKNNEYLKNNFKMEVEKYEVEDEEESCVLEIKLKGDGNEFKFWVNFYKDEYGESLLVNMDDEVFDGEFDEDEFCNLRSSISWDFNV